jgi:hypothetical protein
VIPAAHIHGAATWRASLRAAGRSRAGRVVIWSATLGAVQAALLVGRAGGDVDAARAFGGLTVVLALIAAIVVGTVWFVRFAIPVRRLGRHVNAVIGTAAFYGAAVLAAPAHAALLATALLAPAIVWSWWMPGGTFALSRGAAAACRR